MSNESVTIFRSSPSSVHTSIVPRCFELLSWRSRISAFYGLPIVEVAPAHLSRWHSFPRAEVRSHRESGAPVPPVPTGADRLDIGEAQLTRTRDLQASNEWGRFANYSRFTSSEPRWTATRLSPASLKTPRIIRRTLASSYDTGEAKQSASHLSIKSCVRQTSTGSQNFSNSLATSHWLDHGRSPNANPRLSSGGELQGPNSDRALPDCGRSPSETTSAWTILVGSTICTSPAGHCGGTSRSSGDTPRAMERGFGAF